MPAANDDERFPFTNIVTRLCNGTYRSIREAADANGIPMATLWEQIFNFIVYLRSIGRHVEADRLARFLESYL
ncbi:hypothetical protein HI914_07320 [Erysiphe necator]|uniref:Uncharacterized protein n=1 Tax=Uncinula necator TaxID=52586 RepID=A0A0B1P6S3_UNCNE|nr:hypothetical protein HI914_07320 [Erysiphe necator]KHJ32344.1 hypothetical protein EV44_g5744 [Erysiphe necator]